MAPFNHSNIDQAYELINTCIIKTPLVSNDYINQITGGNILFKLENLQITGSFKFRGASHKIAKLTESTKKNGVVAYSSGNHGQAVAYASQLNNINAKIVMPTSAPKIKINNTKKYGADIILYDPYKEQRESIAEVLADKEKRTIIKPYDDYDIIAGQGTAAKEIVSDLESFNIIPDLYLCCCGGGGLIAGTSTYLKYAFPNICSYSVEPENFDDTKNSLEKGEIVRNSSGSQSICDALLAPQPGKLTFTINQSTLHGGLVVSEEEVKKTIITLAENLKIITEPGGAVAAAAVLHKKINVQNKNVVVMISGGNIDSEMFASLK